MLEERLYHSALFDFYGALLTEKQRRCLTMYLFEDLSLSEIGDALEISRQAVHDMLRRAEDTLAGYEAAGAVKASAEGAGRAHRSI